ncbi:hypothetical protein SporoP37_15670 [Sporosarcina sp. P37]|uniref:ImmA/IrrE family metallo-endopeptidase n=1 Tax=unclassified Sporosarcina TaxID=2647733 RepID=UPI000A17E663|nr:MULTISPECIES: ImmA/IrrE family metallo-endopeptidase [unclassified Sporosarcina]ARK25967.1 hypothetical protein SporoP37_15670 [Sporosarcina sp. P37]PID19334.1 ImmA/IrrE family metallo-endopeptidase [Sporosarcina sp. P35]
MKLRQHTDYWKERADKVLSHFHYTYPDEIDMYDICWRYGIRILPLDKPFIEPLVQDNMLHHLKAFSLPSERSRRGTIFLKEGLDAIEKKLLLAEEFCHLYAHHQTQFSADPYAIGKCENQAKRMAAYLLMPARFMEEVYVAAFEQPVVISEVADYFLVSDEFASYRLELIFKHRVDGFVGVDGKLGTVEWLE